MPRILRTPRAARDVVEIWPWIAAADPAAADRMLDLIEQKLGLRATNLALGPARPDIAADLRLFPIRPQSGRSNQGLYAYSGLAPILQPFLTAPHAVDHPHDLDPALERPIEGVALIVR